MFPLAVLHLESVLGRALVRTCASWGATTAPDDPVSTRMRWWGVGGVAAQGEQLKFFSLFNNCVLQLRKVEESKLSPLWPKPQRVRRYALSFAGVLVSTGKGAARHAEVSWVDVNP